MAYPLGVRRRATPPAARLPLSGGHEGSAVRVTGLLSAAMSGPPAYFFGEPGLTGSLRGLGMIGRWAQSHLFPTGAFLIEHPSAGAVLVDAGVAGEAERDPLRAVGWLGATLFGRPRMRMGQAVAAQLAERGVTVRAVVMTHMHWDHAGGLLDLPGARVLVTRPEWRAAQRRLGPLNGYLRRHLDPSLRFELLDLEQADPSGAFSRSLDLFGDGSVLLVATPGHSPGHLSLVLRLHDRLMLVAGDALYTTRALRGEMLHPSRSWSHEGYLRSLAEMRAFAECEPSALILPGHDLDAWEASGVEATL